MLYTVAKAKTQIGLLKNHLLGAVKLTFCIYHIELFVMDSISTIIKILVEIIISSNSSIYHFDPTTFPSPFHDDCLPYLTSKLHYLISPSFSTILVISQASFC